MNNFKVPGNYYCNDNSIISTLKNCPCTNVFTMKVEYAYGTGYPCQTFRRYDTGQKIYRVFITGSQTWSDWDYFSDDSTIFSGTAINSGDDLNDYTTTGIYRSTSPTITATLLNIPEIFSSGFAMIVLNISVSTNVQVIFAGNNLYMRLSNTSGWQSWYKFEGLVISS